MTVSRKYSMERCYSWIVSWQRSGVIVVAGAKKLKSWGPAMLVFSEIDSKRSDHQALFHLVATVTARYPVRRDYSLSVQSWSPVSAELHICTAEDSKNIQEPT